MKPIFLLLLSSVTFFSASAQYNVYPKWYIESRNHEFNSPVKTISLSTGVKLEYKEQGPAGGIPVLLLHGFTDSWFSYEQVMKYLPSSYHVFSVSQRGHGNSDHPETGYSSKHFAEDIAAFVKAMNLSKVFLVGHSMGSIITQQFVISYPEMVSGIVLEGAFPVIADKLIIQEFKSVVEKLQDPVDRAFVREFQVSTVAKPVRESYMDSLVTESMKLQAFVWKRAWEGFMQFDFRKELTNVNKPALIIWGDKDPYCPLSDQQLVVSALKGSRLVVYNDGGHSLHWEEPERFAADVAKFIESNIKKQE
jgi:pimeloyl-ACP methyl ester carboxylesterase